MKIVKQNILGRYSIREDKSGLFDYTQILKDGEVISSALTQSGAEAIVQEDVRHTVSKAVEASKLLRELGYEVVPPCRVRAKKAKVKSKQKV